MPQTAPVVGSTTDVSATSHRVAVWALLGLRLAVGFEFLWAFFDKTFGWGYATTSAHAWINGGSPTSGFLSHVGAGPLQGLYNNVAGVALVDWVFMLGLLGIGVALIAGVALRPAAVAGVTMLVLMYIAVWPFATSVGGKPSGSTNPIIDDHIVSSMALVVIAALAALAAGPISRRWSALRFVRSHAWLR